MNCVSFSLDARYVFGGSDDGNFYVWDLERGDISTVIEDVGIIDRCAWLPGGEILCALRSGELRTIQPFDEGESES